MTKVYVYICPVDGKTWESREDLGETIKCPEHNEVMKKEGWFEE